MIDDMVESDRKTVNVIFWPVFICCPHQRVEMAVNAWNVRGRNKTAETIVSDDPA